MSNTSMAVVNCVSHI